MKFRQPLECPVETEPIKLDEHCMQAWSNLVHDFHDSLFSTEGKFKERTQRRKRDFKDIESMFTLVDLLRARDHCRDHKGNMASFLSISRNSVYERLKQAGLTVKQFNEANSLLDCLRHSCVRRWLDEELPEEIEEGLLQEH